MQVLSAPIEATLELTNACNLSCSFCYADSGRAYKNELTTGEWESVLSDLAEMGVFVVFLGGGEPLLRADFFQLADFAVQRDLGVAISTNGTIITPRIAQKLKKSNIEPVQVSIDGGTAATHDLLRGKQGAFKKTLEGLSFLKDAGVAYQISTTITKLNFREIGQIYDMAVSYGANALFLANVLQTKRASTRIDSLKVSIEQEFQLLSWVMSLRNNSHIYVRYFGSCEASELVGQKSMNKTDKEFMKCEAGRIRCVVDPIGNVFPCELVRFPFLIAGNVRQIRFQDIWTKDWNVPIFRLSEITRTCNSCDLLDLYLQS